MTLPLGNGDSAPVQGGDQIIPDTPIAVGPGATTDLESNAIGPSTESDEDENPKDNEDDDSDDDDVTVILLDARAAQRALRHAESHDASRQPVVDLDSPEWQERRRNVLLRELQRVQRASFCHFAILCVIPTCLLIFVLVTVLDDESPCESEATMCQREARTFINAFSARCICDSILLPSDN